MNKHVSELVLAWDSIKQEIISACSVEEVFNGLVFKTDAFIRYHVVYVFPFRENQDLNILLHSTPFDHICVPFQFCLALATYM